MQQTQKVKLKLQRMRRQNTDKKAQKNKRTKWEHKKCNDFFLVFCWKKLCQPAAAESLWGCGSGATSVRGLRQLYAHKEMRPICSHRCNINALSVEPAPSRPAPLAGVPSFLWPWVVVVAVGIVVDTLVLAFKTDSQATAAVGSKKKNTRIATHTPTHAHTEVEKWQS